MDQDSQSDWTRSNGLGPHTQGEEAAGAEAPQLDRLPPPFFPPGAGRRHGRRTQLSPDEGGGGVPQEALILPEVDRAGGEGESTVDPSYDLPLLDDAEGFSDDVFIDPDAPIVRTEPPHKPDDFEEVVRGGSGGAALAEMGVVTGIGDYSHLAEAESLDLEPQAYEDEAVADLVRVVGRLADALRARGEAGLRASPDMTRFEATLRAYCVGYLARRRELEEG